MNVDFAPDLGTCRLCGATTRQREFWRERYLGAGQSLRRCGHCAALYLGPDFTEQALDAFYAHAYRTLYLTEIMGRDPDRFFCQRFEARFAAARAIACATSDEIGALDAAAGSVHWTFTNTLTSRAKRALVGLLGSERTGALLLRRREYRRLKRAWHGFRAI